MQNPGFTLAETHGGADRLFSGKCHMRGYTVQAVSCFRPPGGKGLQAGAESVSVGLSFL